MNAAGRIAAALQDVPPGTVASAGSALRVETAGRGRVETYAVLPGIEATFCAFCAEEATFRHAAAPGVLEAHYCRCGRVGWNMRGGLSVFLGAGDLTLHGGACCADSAMQFPLGYAETVGIAFDLAQLAEHPPRALRDAGFQPLALRESLCGGRPAAIPACPALEHIFAPLCAAPPPLRPSYLQLKALELLLALDGLRARAAKLAPCAAQQAERIRAAHALLTGDLRRRYTIEALAKRFLLNTSALKEGFKAVYGAPIATYMKEYRIHRAMERLRETDDPIANIAAEVGYGAQGKFTQAFKDVAQTLPSEYRRQHRGEST